MYTIVFADGKSINVKATEVEWSEKTRTIRLFHDRKVVARINIENIVGWIDADYKAESEE